MASPAQEGHHAPVADRRTEGLIVVRFALILLLLGFSNAGCRALPVLATVGVAVLKGAINAATDTGCLSRCEPGYTCNTSTNLCERLPCAGRCGRYERCFVEENRCVGINTEAMLRVARDLARYGRCPAECKKGFVCNPDVGECVALPCGGRCTANQSCVKKADLEFCESDSEPAASSPASDAP